MSAHYVLTDHEELEGIGVLKHTQIDSHISGSQFLVLSSSVEVSPESRMFIPGEGLLFQDNGPGMTFELSVDIDYLSTVLSASGGGAVSTAEYIVFNHTSSLPNARTLSASVGIELVDGGMGASVGIKIDDNVVATLTGSLFTGPVQAQGGLSGSLQEISPGVSYLIGDETVNVVTQSNEQVKLSLAKPIEMGALWYATTTSSFKQAIPIVNRQGYIVTQRQGYLVVDEL